MSKFGTVTILVAVPIILYIVHQPIYMYFCIFLHMMARNYILNITVKIESTSAALGKTPL